MKSKTLETTVRAPWQDELPRLKAFFGNKLSRAKEIRPFVVLAEKPSRIIGAAGLMLDGDAGTPLKRSAQVHFRIRPAFRQTDVVGKLWQAVLAQARALNLEQLYFEIDTGSDASAQLPDHARRIKTEELWQLELRKVWARLEKLESRLKVPEGWTRRLPQEDDLPAIGELAEHYKLRTKDEIELIQEKSSKEVGNDPTISSIVLDEQGLLAVVLVQNACRLNCHTDLRMVHPRAKERSGHLNLILLADALRRGIKAGYTTTTLTVNTGRDRETRRLAERSGGRLLKSVDLWTLDL